MIVRQIYWSHPARFFTLSSNHDPRKAITATETFTIGRPVGACCAQVHEVQRQRKRCTAGMSGKDSEPSDCGLFQQVRAVTERLIFNQRRISDSMSTSSSQRQVRLPLQHKSIDLSNIGQTGPVESAYLSGVKHYFIEAWEHRRKNFPRWLNKE